ncbi:hypothetical protein F5888DRAFT_1169493 [Russula emetica]|nr:hypothetical protein F5888DRAFT_1169493 [Russula emetica]
MARGFYTVIVGTQPGIYTDWTQAALRVSEISGAIFKRYKTYPDALDAFNNAMRDGKVRAVQVDLDPEPEAELLPGFQVREQAPHEYPVVRPIPHSATRPGQSFHRSRTPRSSTGAEIIPSIYASQFDLAERTGLGTVGIEPREHQSFGQPSRPADGNQILLPTGSSRGHDNERWQEIQHDSTRALPILSRADRGTAFAHHEPRSTSISAEPERRRMALESASAALSPSPQPGPSTLRVFGSPQMDDYRFRVSGNVACQHDRPPSASPLADVRSDDIRSNSSNGFSFSPPTSTPLVNRPLYVEPPHASGSQGPIANPVASPRAHAHCMSDRKGKRRASVQSPDAYINSFDGSEIRRSVPSPQTRMMEIGDSSGPPGLLLRSSSPCSHISVASSNETLSVFSFEVNISAVETSRSPGRSAHMPQLTVSPFAVSSLVENAIPDLSTQSQEGLNGEDNRDNSQDLQVVSSGDAKFGILGDFDVVDPASVEHTDSPRSDLSVLFDDSPTLIRLQSPLEVASTSRASTHLLTQSGLDTTSPPRVWPLWSPSLPPYVDQEAPRSTEVTGLGLSIEGIMSPHSHPLQHHMTTRAPLRTPPHRHAGSIDRQSTTGDDTSPWDAPAPAPQAQESPSYLRSVISNLMQQSEGTRSTNDDAAPLNSPSNIPLPSSPTTSSTSGSPARLRLQVQPSHRSSPSSSNSNTRSRVHPASTSRLGSRLDLDDRHRARRLFRRQHQHQHQHRHRHQHQQ